ncbi:MAG TPA: 2-amino-4-hydroxy-6-hydroxymethyldihydropteridine diphosphokinase [Vicinamibacterales bacterium]|nr:2-amino-4-hydroxy-6-hydroxymethyldihydropteridine diphosphokinase [Vicinamibacterales bacterium]
MRCAIALGSNLGDRAGHLDFAVNRLRTLLTDLTVSDYIDTEPVGVAGQPRYLNAVLVGRPPAGMTPRALLVALLALERERGRERPFQAAPRTLDLDLVLYGDVMVKEKGLEIPHPRFRERAFVLGPLASIAPELVDPVTGRTVMELLKSSF